MVEKTKTIVVRVTEAQHNWLNAHLLGKSAAVRQAIDDAMKAEQRDPCDDCIYTPSNCMSVRCE